MGLPSYMIELIEMLYQEQQASFRIVGERSGCFKVHIVKDTIIKPHGHVSLSLELSVFSALQRYESDMFITSVNYTINGYCFF